MAHTVAITIMLAEISWLSQVTANLAKHLFSANWSQVTPLAKQFKMVQYCPTNDMISNITKSLIQVKFEKFCSLLGLLWSCVHLKGECCNIKPSMDHTYLLVTTLPYYSYQLIHHLPLTSTLCNTCHTSSPPQCFYTHWGVSPLDHTLLYSLLTL